MLFYSVFLSPFSSFFFFPLLSLCPATHSLCSALPNSSLNLSLSLTHTRTPMSIGIDSCLVLHSLLLSLLVSVNGSLSGWVARPCVSVAMVDWAWICGFGMGFVVLDWAQWLWVIDWSFGGGYGIVVMGLLAWVCGGWVDHWWLRAMCGGWESRSGF